MDDSDSVIPFRVRRLVLEHPGGQIRFLYLCVRVINAVSSTASQRSLIVKEGYSTTMLIQFIRLKEGIHIPM